MPKTGQSIRISAVQKTPQKTFLSLQRPVKRIAKTPDPLRPLPFLTMRPAVADNTSAAEASIEEADEATHRVSRGVVVDSEALQAFHHRIGSKNGDACPCFCRNSSLKKITEFSEAAVDPCCSDGAPQKTSRHMAFDHDSIEVAPDFTGRTFGRVSLGLLGPEDEVGSLGEVGCWVRGKSDVLRSFGFLVVRSMSFNEQRGAGVDEFTPSLPSENDRS